MIRSTRIAVLAVIPFFAVIAESRAQDAVTATAETERVVVTGRVVDMLGYATTSSEGEIGTQELADRPISRRGEMLEAVPGVIITQHSGEAKANQYFLRGFNLDHGTDFALSADGMPVNMRTHAHGQGYADVNFIIPELIDGISYSKGPFFAEVGDFSGAGAAEFHLFPVLPRGFATVTIGEDNFYRLVLGDSWKLKTGTITAAFEYGHYDGPYTLNENSIRYNGFARWAWGDTNADKFSLTFMAYHGHAHSPDQTPQRAIDDGSIPRLGAIDSTDALTSDRESLSFDWLHSDDAGTTHLNAYLIYYHLDIFSDFTYFLDDPVHGDQFEQLDTRFIAGASLTHTWEGQSSAAATRKRPACRRATTSSRR